MSNNQRPPSHPYPQPSTAGSSGASSQQTAGGFAQQQQQPYNTNQPRQSYPSGRSQQQHGAGNPSGGVPNRANPSVRPPSSSSSSGGNIPSSSNRQPQKNPKYTPGNQPYTTPSPHATGQNYSQPSNQTKFQTFGRKYQEVTVGQLSSRLGFPDVYYCEQDRGGRIIPELSFTSTFAREGYIDRTFNAIDREPIDPMGSFFGSIDKPSSFFSILERTESILREEHKTFSTNKTREEMKQRLENAVNSCNCSAGVTSFLPKLENAGAQEFIKILSGKHEDKCTSHTSLRELSTRVSRHNVTSNLFQYLSTYNVPFFRALWYTKILIRDKGGVNVKELSQDLTSRFCEYMTSACSDENDKTSTSDAKKRHSTVIYIINFLAYCLEENMLYEPLLCQKLLEMLESKFGAKAKTTKETPLMDAYFFSMLSVKTQDQIYNQLFNFISASKKVSPTVKFYILQLFKLYMTYSSDSKFMFEIYRRLNPSQQQLSLDSVKDLFYNFKDDIYVVNVLDRISNITELYNTLLYNKEIGTQIIAPICTWSITGKRLQRFRPYIAASLINNFVRKNPDLKKVVQNTLFKDVLDSCEESSKDEYLNMIQLFNELILQENFSVGEYIKHLISRGFDFEDNEAFKKRHTTILTNLPTYEPSTKTKINSLLHGPRYNSNNLEAKRSEAIQTEIKNGLSSIIRGEVSPDHTRNLINNLQAIPEIGIKFEITQWIISELDLCDIRTLKEEIVDNLLCIALSVGNYRAFRDIVHFFITKLGTESQSHPLEIKIFSTVRNAIQLFNCMDNVEIFDNFLQRYNRSGNNRNIQTIIQRNLSEISNSSSDSVQFDQFKGKFPKLAGVIDTLTTPPTLPANPELIASSSSNHEFIDYLVNQGDSLTSETSYAIIHNYASRNVSQRFLTEQVYSLVRFAFEGYHRNKNTCFVHILRNSALQKELFEYSTMIDCLTKLAYDVLGNGQTTIDVVNSLAQFFIRCIISGLISGHTFINNVLFVILDNLKSRISNIQKSQHKATIFFPVYWVRIFLSFNKEANFDKMNVLLSECGIFSESIEQNYDIIHSNIVVNTLFECLRPIESKEVLLKMTATCKHIFDQIKTVKKAAKELAPTVSAVFDAMIEILHNFMDDERTLQDISRSLTYTQDCLGSLYELPSPPPADQGKTDYGNKYQAISKLIGSLYKPFSEEIRSTVTDRLTNFLSQSSKVDVYIDFVFSITERSDKWRITVDSHLVFLYMFTWNRRKPITRDLFQHFVGELHKRRAENTKHFAKSLLLASFYTTFAELQDVVLDQFKIAISDKKQQDVECLLPIVEELIKLDQGKAETACRHVMEAINVLLKNVYSTPQSNTNRERLTTCLLCLKEIIFSSNLLETQSDDKFSDKRKTQILPEIKRVLITLSTSKILPSIFNTAQKSDDFSLTNIYYLIYGMLGKLKVPQDELNKDFERLFQKEVQGSLGNANRRSVSTPTSATTPNPTMRRTPLSSGSKVSPITSPQQQSPVPMSPQIATVKSEQSRTVNNWLIIEDYVANCAHCSATHGNLTPARFTGSKVVKKTDLLFGKKVVDANSNVKKRKDREFDSATGDVSGSSTGAGSNQDGDVLMNGESEPNKHKKVKQ